LAQMQQLIEQGYPLQRSDVSTGMRVLRDRPEANLVDFFTDDAIQASVRRVVTPRNVAQKFYLQAMQENDITFGVGPAGTGKTFLAVAAAAGCLAEKSIKRIVLCRPAAEAGERLGFLPGDVTQVDLPEGRKSGLREVRRILEGIEGIKFFDFSDRDVVRHPVVAKVVTAYDRHDRERKTE